MSATVDPTGLPRTVSADESAGTVQEADDETSISAPFDPLGRVLSRE